MLERLLWVMVLLLTAAGVALAQGTFQPRDADEVHAWDLYNQYKASKQAEADLQKRIKDLNASIGTTAVGVGAIAANNAEDRAERASLQAELAKQRERQTKLIAAWDKKYYGRYAHLQESSKQRFDNKTKRMMDEIEFQLTYFPFKPNSGKAQNPIGNPNSPPSSNLRNEGSRWKVYGCGMTSCTKGGKCGTSISTKPLTVVPSVHRFLRCASVDVHLPDGSDFEGFFELLPGSVVITQLK